MLGRLIAIEGPKGVGKTTLMQAFQDRVSGAQSSRWVFTKEPTPSFDLNNEERLTGEVLAEHIAADRSRHVDDLVAPTLRTGVNVVCDRYILSSFVFQTLDGASREAVTALNSRFPRPDLTVILLCSEATLLARRDEDSTHTRLSRNLLVGDETLAYLNFASESTEERGRVLLCYNETMSDCSNNIERIVAELESL